MIRFDNVTKKYGNRVILDDVTFSVSPGDFVTVTGPSGSGKTTLIHLLLGADKPTSGNIKVDDFHIPLLTSQKLQEYRRNIGTIFQDYKLLPKHSVFENVAFAMEVLDKKAHEIIERVPKILETVGLHGHQDHYPHQLSGGEKQRVAIARALVHNPHLILADEPTGNLDPEQARGIMKLLLDLNRGGITVFLTTHNPELIRLTPKQIFELRAGKIHRIVDRKTLKL